MTPIAAIQLPRSASLAEAEIHWASHELNEPTIGTPSGRSLVSSLSPSGGLDAMSDKSTGGAQAVGKSDGFPRELLDVIGGVAATVAFGTAAFTVGPVAGSTLPAALVSAPTAGTSFFAAFLGI